MKTRRPRQQPLAEHHLLLVAAGQGPGRRRRGRSRTPGARSGPARPRRPRRGPAGGAARGEGAQGPRGRGCRRRGRPSRGRPAAGPRSRRRRRARSAARGAGRRAWPATRTSPLATGSRPKRARSGLGAPGAHQPGEARRPRRACTRDVDPADAAPGPDATGLEAPPRRRATRAGPGRRRSISRPTIRETRRASSKPARGPPPTTAPSRRTTTSSAETQHVPEGVGDVDDGTPPCARSRPTIANRRSVSRALSEVVGSSRITTRASTASALAISTSCRSPGARPLHGRRPGTRRGPPASSRARAALLQPGAVDERAAPGQGVAGTGSRRRSGSGRGSAPGARRRSRGPSRRTATRGRVGRAVEPHRAPLGREHPAEDVHQRRLAGPVLADQAEDAAPAEGERDVLQHRHAEEALLDVPELEERRAGCAGEATLIVRPPSRATRRRRPRRG